MKNFLSTYFQLKEHGAEWKTEVIAGVTTFMTMAYIIFVNPAILSKTGMDFNGVMMATILASAIATLMMGFYAKLPFALAPGMGLNAYFAFSVVLGMGISWQVALAAVLIDGIIFLIISILPIREQIIKGVPMSIKLAAGVGIGLFIALIGLVEAKIVVANPATLVALGDVAKDPKILLAFFGLFLMGFLMAKKVKGALLWGIIITSLLGWLLAALKVPGMDIGYPVAIFGSKGLISVPPFGSLGNVFGKFDFKGALGLGFVTIVFTFTFVDMFDTVGTLMGLSSKLGIIDKTGSFPGAGKALITDAVGTTAGAVLGTSTVTTYIESAAGVAEGGKTGLTAVVTGVLFLIALFLSPLAGFIPVAATAPALIIVGVLMASPVLKLNFDDITEAIPAYITLAFMPFTYSIAQGLVFGIISYTVIKIISGRAKEVSLVMWILTILFIIYIFWPVITK